MRPSELARAGAEGLRTWGWARGPQPNALVHAETTPCCVLDTLERVCHLLSPGRYNLASRAAADRLTDGMREIVGRSIGNWNDTVCNSQEEAIALLESVAARFEESGQ